MPENVPAVSSKSLLNAARKLFETAHKVRPFMTLNSGPDGCILSMKFQSLHDGTEVHSALVNFFAAHKGMVTRNSKKHIKKIR